MSATPMNVYFSGKKAPISSSGGSVSVDLSNYATKDDLQVFNDSIVDSVIETLHNMAEDVDFVKTYTDTRTDDDSE